MKKFASLLLAMLMVCTMMTFTAIPAFAEESSPAGSEARDSHTHEYKNGVCTICGENGCGPNEKDHTWVRGVCTV